MKEEIALSDEFSPFGSVNCKVIKNSKNYDINVQFLKQNKRSNCGKYKILECLFGAGLNRLSQIYLAEDNNSEKYIAKINVPSIFLGDCISKSEGMGVALRKSNHKQRTDNEIRMLQRLAKNPHEGIMKLVDNVSFLGFNTLMLERKEQNGTLRSFDHLQKHQLEKHNIPIDKDWFPYHDVQTLESAIFHLISNGIVHRDIKPDNLVLYYDEEKSKNSSFLIDFGEANMIDEPCYDLINREYAAPEYFYGMQHPYSDLYSLGLLMYESILNRTFIGYIPQVYTIFDLIKRDKKLFGAGKTIETTRKYFSDKLIFGEEKIISILKDYNYSVVADKFRYSGLEPPLDVVPYLDDELENYVRRTFCYLNFDPDKRVPPNHLFKGSLLQKSVLNLY